MTTFFLDLWQDLREKRLWPVAVGLLAAAVAIPAIMLKPAAEPTAPPVVASDSGPAETLPAVNVDDAPAHGSKLETFSTRNPFKPMSDLEDEQTTDAPDSGPSGLPGDPAPDGPGGGGGNGGGPPADVPGGGSSGGGGSRSDVPGGSRPSGSDGGMHWFKYTADIRFGKADATKRMKSVEPLTILPK